MKIQVTVDVMEAGEYANAHVSKVNDRVSQFPYELTLGYKRYAFEFEIPHATDVEIKSVKVMEVKG